VEDLLHEIHLLRVEIKELSIKKRELEAKLAEQVDFESKNAIEIPSTLYKAKISKKQKYSFKDIEELKTQVGSMIVDKISRVKFDVDVKAYKSHLAKVQDSYIREALIDAVEVKEEKPYLELQAVTQ